MSEKSVLTIQLPVESITRLDGLAKETSRSRSDLAIKAIEQFLDVNEWQTTAIEEALAEAESPNAKFIDHEDVVRHMKNLINR
jgi:predicted transcriptional regulator